MVRDESTTQFETPSETPSPPFFGFQLLSSLVPRPTMTVWGAQGRGDVEVLDVAMCL